MTDAVVDAPTFTPALDASRAPLLSLAIIGAGPVGLALALQAARALPEAAVTVFDARPADRDVSGDPRTLALSLGSVQILTRLGVWAGLRDSGAVEPILKVHVSQQQPALLWPGRRPPQVTISAQQEAVPQLGAVLSYGTLVSPLQQAWLAAVAAEPHRLSMRFATPVRGLKPMAHGVEVDADIADRFDVAVIAEGGVFADQPALRWPEGLSHDYGQTAWVGQVLLDAGAPRGVACERFTPAGPAALLPLPPGSVVPGGPSGPRAALVWCVDRRQDPVQALDDAQRLVLLGSVFPPEVGPLRQLSPLKAFPLGLNVHRRLVSDGAIVRVGNAAQTLHPVAGQGLNLGLRDGQVLLDALSGIVPGLLRNREPQQGAATPQSHAELIARALARFERQRQPDRLALVAATDFLARSFTWSPPALAGLRGVAMGLLQAAPPLKSGLARMMMFGHR